MSGINSAHIVGRVGRDPETRYTANGTAVTNISVATSEKWDGEERTEWHRITCWGKTAEVAGQYVQKGALIGIHGRLQTRKWQDKDGNDRYTTEIVADRLYLLGKGGDGQRAQDDGGADPMEGSATAAPAKPAAKPASKPAAKPAAAAAPPMDDDIPF